MADTEKTKTETKEISIAESVAKRIKSRSAKPVILDGKASRFDLRRYGAHDFSAGGQLKPRLVMKTDDRIKQMMAEGYDFPQEWDARLPSIEMAGMVLMLRSTEHAEEAQQWHLKHAQDLDKSKAPGEHAEQMAPDLREGAKFMSDKTQTQTLTVAADTKSRVMGPE